MKRFAPRLLLSHTVILFFATVGTSARADAISSYTITDLGAVFYQSNATGGVTLSAPTGSNATVTATNGSVYSFPVTDNSVADPSSLLAKLPALANPYAGNPAYNPTDSESMYYYYREYEYAGGAFLNKNGVAVATELDGVSGHIASASSSVDAFQRQPDGSFVAIGGGATSPNNRDTGGTIASAIALNNSDQLLSVGASSLNYSWGPFTTPTFLLTDLKTGVTTNLQDLLPAGWHLDLGQILALSDTGQIIVSADNTTLWTTQHIYEEDALLLTPAGLSTDPIATPEPSTLATLAAAGLALAIRRWRRS